MPKQIAETYSKEVREYLEKRGIDMKTALREKIFEYSMGGKPIMGFPFYINMTLVNVKYFSVRWKTGDESPKWFQMKKDLGTRSIFLGMQNLSFDEGEKKEVIITEGEWDFLTWKQCGYKNVVSVPMGAPNPNAKEFEHEFDYANDKYVQSFFADVTSIIFSTDNDAPGHKLRNQLALIFGKERCKYIQYPVGYKDINDVFKGNNKSDTLLPALGKAGVDECYNNLSSFPIAGIISPHDCRDDLNLIVKNGFTAGLGIGIPEIDRLYTLKPKHITFVSGIPSCFAKDQLIHTARGTVPISNIEIGDKVLCYNHKKDLNEYKDVLEKLTNKNHPEKLFKITLKDGTIIKVTANHKFFTGISYLQIKEILLSLKNNSKK
jgi:twinkle protein